MRICSLVTLSLLSNRNIVNRLIESMDDIIESTSSVEGEPIASDDDVSIAAPPKIHRLLSVDSEKEGDSQQDHSSPGAFAEYGKKLLKSRCIDEGCMEDHCEHDDGIQQISQQFPGINIIPPEKPILAANTSFSQTTQGLTSSRPKPRAAQLPPRHMEDDFKTFVAVIICHSGIHMHTFTCKKPPKGWHGCRLCFPKALSNGTRPIELLASVQPDGTTQWDELDPHITEYEIEEPDGSPLKGSQDCIQSWDPDRYNTKELIYPLQSDSSRTVIWELNRPVLKDLDPLQEDVTKEEIISRLCEEMLPSENEGDSERIRSSVFKDASISLPVEQVDLHHFDEEDNNNLFFTLLLGLIESSRLKAGKKSVQCIRSELMGHLRTKGHKYKFDESDTSTVARYIESRMDAEHVTEDTMEQYIQLMENVTGDDCFEGGELEIRLFAEMEKLNVAVYEEEVCNEGEDEDVGGVLSKNSKKYASYKRVEFFGTDKDRTTIHLCREPNHGVDNPRYYQGKAIRPAKYHYKLMTSKLKGVTDSLHELNLYDLKVLYGLVSKHLPERNGKVVEFNPYLTSVLGCNSNLIYLGSSEQSKSALFYIGPYINKDGVKIIDALPILLKAREDALKYPSIAEDSNTTKRHAQHVLTRAINKMNGLIEVSDTQIAASLLKMDASLCSESFVTCNTTAYENFVDTDVRRGINLDHDELDCSDNVDAMDKDEIADELQNMFYSKDRESGDASDEDDLGHDESSMHSITQSLNEEEDYEDESDDDFAFINASFGFCPFFKMNDGTKQPISYAALYRYRGKALGNLNRYEYSALVQVVQTKNESNDTCTSGRSSSKRFPFEKGLGIENNYHQCLRSKAMTPKFTRSPPAPPKNMPHPPDLDESDDEDGWEKYKLDVASWRRKADRFAHFYLTMFRPETELYKKDQTNTYKYDYDAFVKFYKYQLLWSRVINDSIISRLRLELIDFVIESWRVDREKREMLAAHRGRARTMWSAEEREASKEFFGGNLKPVIGDDGLDYISNVVQDMSSQEKTDARKHLGHSSAILSTLVKLDDKTVESNTTTRGGSDSRNSRQRVLDVPFDMELDESKRKSKAKSTYSVKDGNVSTTNMYCTVPDLDKKVKEYIEAQDLSADKDIVINIAHDHFKAIRSGRARDKDYEAPNVLVCGKPGNGKSKIIESLDGIVEIMKVGEQMKNAYMGSAAVGIRGTTLLRTWNIPVFSEGQRVTFRPWNGDALQALKRRFGQNVENICAVVIDEISTVQPYMLAYLNIRMQELFGNDKPFGGRMVILLGDFQQKPPTAGGDAGTLPGCMMSYIEEKGKPMTLKSAEKLGLAQTGGYLFSKFRYIKLTSQHRSGDPKHMALLDKMSSTGVITVEDLKNTYKKLSAEDMESDDFRFATNIVTGNAERREINAWQAKRWAKYHGVNTVRWPRKREGSWKGRPRNEACIAHAMQHSSFWEFYIPEAMGYLNTSNINSDDGLANGTVIKYHSLSFEDKHQRSKFRLQCAQAAPGNVIDLDFPPTAINVELFPDFDQDSVSDKAKKEKERKEWLESGKGSITQDGRVVIPISMRDGKKIQSKKTYIPGCVRMDSQYYYLDSSVMLKDYFPIEPAFSITVDKAQVGVEYI